MGEKIIQKNGVGNEKAKDNNDDSQSDEPVGVNEEEDDITPEEFQMLDSQLDALNSELDKIEQKNDSIHAELLNLLIKNREIRKEFQESKIKANSDVEKSEV